MTGKQSLVCQVVGGLVLAAALVGLLSAASAQTETVLYNFTGSDGTTPEGSLVFDAAGNLYGTALTGGIRQNGCLRGGCGVLFQLSPSSSGWSESAVHNFGNIRDGAHPDAGAILDTVGNLYVTTLSGGSVGGNGTAVEFSPTGTGTWQETLLYLFRNDLDGGVPQGRLVFATDGTAYGVTSQGGKNRMGTAFKLTPTLGSRKKETVILSFPGGGKGLNPMAGLVLDGAGNLYGTTFAGGDLTKCAPLGQQGCGVVYELSPTASGGWQETVLHTFSGGADGAASTSDLVRDASGNLYGTASAGGDIGGCFFPDVGCGVVFELSPQPGGGWTETVLHAFSGRDGAVPQTGLTFDSAGNLYGTTFRGGNLSVCGIGCGVVYELSPQPDGSWSETVLHKFGVAGHDGSLPIGGVILDAAGNVYGTTTAGGTNGLGTVFQITR